MRSLKMSRSKSRRSAFNPPAKVGGFFTRVRAARPLVQPANSRFRTNLVRHSATSLISTVPDDTRKQVRPRSDRFSPQVRSRATHRSSRVPTPWQTVFDSIPLPKRAITCAKRSIRREVLHALKLTGKGAKAPYRRVTDDSKEKCK